MELIHYRLLKKWWQREIGSIKRRQSKRHHHLQARHVAYSISQPMKQLIHVNTNTQIVSFSSSGPRAGPTAALVFICVSLPLCEHAQWGEPGRAGVIGCGGEKKGNLVVSLAKLNQTIFSSPFPPPDNRHIVSPQVCYYFSDQVGRRVTQMTGWWLFSENSLPLKARRWGGGGSLYLAMPPPS